MKILVTGANGFIGNNLIPKLYKNHKVVCLVRNLEKAQLLKKYDIEMIEEDLKNKLTKIPKNIDVVVHLVGGGNVSSITKKDWELLRELNVKTTENLLKALPKNTHVIFVSSISANGVYDKVVVNENTPDIPSTPHEIVKKEAENVIKKSGFPFTIIRPPAVYGPHAKHSDILLMSKIIKTFKVFPIFGNGNNHIPYIYVEDLVGLIIKAIDTKGKNKTYIVTHNNNPTFNELVTLIGKELETKCVKMHLPYLLTFVPVKIMGLILIPLSIAPPLNTKRLKSMVSDRKFDISKVEKDLGYLEKFTFYKGLKNTLKWYKEQNEL